MIAIAMSAKPASMASVRPLELSELKTNDQQNRSGVAQHRIAPCEGMALQAQEISRSLRLSFG